MARTLGTVKEIESERKPGVYSIRDCPNLYLQIQRSTARGAKPGEVTRSWLLRFQLNGKPGYLGGGALHTRKLVEAKEWAREKRLLLLEGINPREHRDAKDRERIAAASRSKSFAECAAELMRARRAEWRSAKHAAQWESTLRTFCYPAWRDKPVSEIDTPDVLAVLEPIWQTMTPTATRLRGRIEEVLDWATFHKYRGGENPARWKGHLDRALAKPSKIRKPKHHAALPYNEIAGFVKQLREQSGDAARALELIILTNTRTSEAIAAKKSEVDLQVKSWTIPPERTDLPKNWGGGKGMKAGKAHRVPLTGRAVEIFREMFAAYPESEWVFPSRDGRPLSNMACLKLLERMSRDDLTVHGFRSSFRDWAGEETNFPRDVIEMAMAHRVAGKTEESYWRGDLYEKRRRLMEAWAAYCERADRPASVHAIEDKRSAKRRATA